MTLGLSAVAGHGPEDWTQAAAPRAPPVHSASGHHTHLAHPLKLVLGQRTES